MIGDLFNTILYEPILNLLIILYNLIPIKDIGLAIIALTVILRAVLWPLQKKTIEAQKKMKDLQPKMQEINEKYKDNPSERGQALMAMYKENKANPASSCIPLLIQLPILWAVFQVFRTGLENETLPQLYSFVSRPEIIDALFLNISFFDLAERNIPLTLLTAGVQFWQSKMMMTTQPAIKSPGSKDEGFQATMNKQMLYIMPVVTVIIGISLPGGLMLYWMTSTLLMGLQQIWMFREPKHPEVIRSGE